MNIAKMARYRYPGTQSFQTADASVFYGRDADIQQMMRLIRLEQLVVLYGKSGLGKSSLLNAGILPKLKDESKEENSEKSAINVEQIRFGAYNKNLRAKPVNIIGEQLWHKEIHPTISSLGGHSDSLWCRAKSRELYNESKEELLLIFDQFEELFTFPQEAILSFKTGLAAILQEGSPLWLREKLSATNRDKEHALSRVEQRALLAPLKVKVLLIVRSDRLSLLDQFTSHLPNILVNLYELKPLNLQSARAAIIYPAQKNVEGFISLPFSYAPSATKTILNGLSNQAGEIESFQLQLLCQHLEYKVIENPDLSVIQNDDFGGEEGIQQILHNYYERQIATLPLGDQPIAQRFIEEGLVVNGHRAVLTAGAEKVNFGVSQQLLLKLLDTRLVRSANIHLGKVYELSHDTLVEPVMKSLESRKAREEQERIAEELRIAEQKNKEERQKQRRARQFSILGFSLFFIAAIASVFAGLKYQEAERSNQHALASELAARSWEIYPRNHTLALRVAESALTIDDDNEDVEQTLHQIINNSETSFYKKVLQEHYFEIQDIAFSPDGQYMATAGYDHKVILWDIEGNVIHQYLGKRSGGDQPGHSSKVQGIDFTADGKFIVSVGADDLLKMWNTTTGELEREWEVHKGGAHDIDIASDNTFIVTAGEDNLVKKWSLTGQLLVSLEGHRGAVNDVEISEDSQMILSISKDGSARLWNRNGQLINIIVDGEIPLNEGAFLSGKKEVLIAKKNALAELYNFKGERLETYSGHKSEVTSVDPFPNADYMLTASEDGTAKVWTYNGEVVITLVGHQKRLNFARVSPNEKMIATGGFDFTVKLWDVDYNLDIQRRRHQSFIHCVDVSVDSKKILTASKDGTAKLWQADGKWIADFNGHTERLQSAFFVPGKEEVITASIDGSVRIWNYQGEELLKIKDGAIFNMAKTTANRARIIACTGDGRVMIWDENGHLLKEWEANGKTSRVASVDINPDENQIMTTTENIVQLWDFEGEIIDSFRNNNTLLLNRAFYANDGQSIYTVGEEFPVRQWSLKGEALTTFYGHSDVNYWVAIHPDQALIASASWDQTLKFWNTNNGKLIRSIPHPNGLYSVAFAPDNSFVVTGSHDNIGRIWSLEGKLIAALGERVNYQEVVNAKEVAPLSGIPFSVTEVNIPEKNLAVLAKNDPYQYLREADFAKSAGQQNRYTLDEKIQFFDQAISYYQKAEGFLSEDTIAQVNYKLAEVYKLKGEQLIIHQDFSNAIKVFNNGLKYEKLDYLIVLKTIALAFNGEDEKVATMCRKYKGLATPQIEWYANYNEAVINDIEYFMEQFGLKYNNLEKIKKLLE